MVIPAGADLAFLSTLPLRTRTRQCLLRAYNTEALREGQSVTVGDLQVLPNFGIVSLLDLMSVTEAALSNGNLPLPSAKGSGPPTLAPRPERSLCQESLEAPTGPAQEFADDPRDEADRVWDTAIEPLKKLLGVAGEFRGARTLADALDIDLTELAASLQITGELDRIPISELVTGPTLAEETISALTDLLDSLSPLEQSILEQRLLGDRRATLEELGQAFDLSRERIRQIESRLRSTLGHPTGRGPSISRLIGAVAALVRTQIEPIVSESQLRERTAAIFRVGDESATDLATGMLRSELGYICSDEICLNPEAAAVRQKLEDAACSLADEVGLLEESDLKAQLPNANWHQYWDVLVDQCNLHRISGRLALRNTAKARAKAALLAIGRPATKEEVAELSGLAPDRAGAQLSLLPSVVRADKRRWGLAEWVEDEYEGIPAEIIQRIEEDGGATRLERLLDELPRMFDVSENSVRSYVGTPRFELSDGYVNIADKSSIALRPLDDVVHGRLANGTPYWSFKVESRYFDGYSLVGLPPEIANALGCEPEDRTRVWLSFPSDCGRLSVTWRLASMTGATLGYLAEPLRRLEVQAEDRVRLVLESVGHASLQREDPSNGLCKEDDGDSPPHEDSPAASPSADRARELLERMKHRRRGV